MINKSIGTRLILSVALFCGVVANVSAIQLNTAATLQTSCAGDNHDFFIYFSGTTTADTNTRGDSFWTPGLTFINSSFTSVTTWSGNGGSLDINCTTASNWFRVSNVSPGNNLPVMAVQNNTCTINRNTNPAIPFAQFVYNIAYKTEAGIAQPESISSLTYEYVIPGTSNYVQIPDQRMRLWAPAAPATPIIHDNECANYYARWCGDGIVSNGEVCDPAAPGQSSATCDAVTCQPISAPFISIKKYAKVLGAVGDTQSAPISIARGEAFNYYYQIQNTGSVAATGVVVKDTLPSYLTYSGTIRVTDPSGVDVTSDWTTLTGSSIFPGETVSRIWLIMTKNTPFPANHGLYTFTVPVVLAPNAPVAISMQNIAYICATNTLSNPTGPGGVVICGNNNPPPPPPTGQCTPTNNPNTDPACIIVPGGGGGGGGSTFYIPTCINGIRSCSAQVHNSLPGCSATTGQTCYTDATSCNTANTLVCSGPGGGGGGGGGGDGRCGDGVLGSSPGEECDVIGAPWCVSCKIQLDTTPGANPITDLWMTIPVLAGTQHLGYTWLDGIPGKIAFSDNRMVLGVGTKAFTLADTVGFGVKTQYHIPLMIEADKKICLKSEGLALNSMTICTTFGAEALDPMIWTRIDGTRYVVIGQGEFQSQKADRTYERMVANSPNNITLFRGSTQYSPGLTANNVGPTLNSTFFGSLAGADSTIGLYTDTGVDLVKLSVHVSGAMVSSIGSASNRKLEAFLNMANPFTGFLGGGTIRTSTTSNNTATTTTVTLPTIVGIVANPTIASVADLTPYRVNGNPNIFAVNGDLMITCPAGSTVFTMTGVRSVIVTGNLIVKCNIVYGSADSTSSWAWITRDGNIAVSNGTGPLSGGAITNLAGVYVAVGDNVNTGRFIPAAGTNNTTQAILRVEGTLYGNATPLFQSRLYARATGAYDILTTGTILTYSNRALVSPPPLLSQYLNTYQVQRVVQ